MKPRIVCGREAVAEPNPCVKHRPSLTGNDIAGNRISCTPQKLQGMSARVKIGRDGWRRSGKRAGRIACHATGRSWNQGADDRRAPHRLCCIEEISRGCGGLERRPPACPECPVQRNTLPAAAPKAATQACARGGTIWMDWTGQHMPAPCSTRQRLHHVQDGEGTRCTRPDDTGAPVASCGSDRKTAAARLRCRSGHWRRLGRMTQLV